VEVEDYCIIAVILNPSSAWVMWLSFIPVVIVGTIISTFRSLQVHLYCLDEQISWSTFCQNPRYFSPCFLDTFEMKFMVYLEFHLFLMNFWNQPSKLTTWLVVTFLLSDLLRRHSTCIIASCILIRQWLQKMKVLKRYSVHSGVNIVTARILSQTMVPIDASEFKPNP
jgi:hypothetical protein